MPSLSVTYSNPALISSLSSSIDSDFNHIIIIVRVQQLCVHQSIVNVLVSKQPHDVNDIFSLMVFHSSFPVAKCVECDLLYSRILYLFSYSSPSFCVEPSQSLQRSRAKYFVCFRFSRQSTDHVDKDVR